MVYEFKQGDDFEALFEKITGRKRSEEEKKGKKPLEKHFGCLKRGFDGLEYQRIARYGEWD